MTVYVAQHRINDMNDCAIRLENIIKSLKDNIPESDKVVIDKYGIDTKTLFDALQFLRITATNFQEDLNNCEVDCKCW